jgi:pyruvate-formate lyase-activating enzyme
MSDAAIPSAEDVEARLAELLARGSVNLGAGAKTERLMLMLTRSCELRCSYCMVEKTETGLDMPPSIAHRAIDLLMRSERPRLQLQLFGGEPTRRWESVLDAWTYAAEHPALAGRELRLILTTNGIALDDEKIRVLEDRDVTVLFSLDGSPENHRRFRAAHLCSDDHAYASILRSLERIGKSRARWFMHSVFPPAAASDVGDRYRWAQARGIPRLQLAYAVGARWNEQQARTWLEGLVGVLREHHREPGALELFNWRNGAEPLILSDDLTVDVDGTVLHDGAIFLERGFPALRTAYRQGHLDTLVEFDSLRWSFAKLYAAMQETYDAGTPERTILEQNVRFGAAVDLTIDRLTRELGRRGRA